MNIYSIPSSKQLENVSIQSPLEWDALQKLTQVYPQTDESFAEQRLVVQSCTNAINQYIFPQATFVKIEQLQDRLDVENRSL